MFGVLCRFKFKCPNKWEDMQETGQEKVRFCAKCSENVYLAENAKAFDTLAIEGKCAAIEVEGMMWMGEPEPLAHEYVLYFPAQEILDEKLQLVQQTLHPDLSLLEVKNKYHLQEVSIDIGGNHEKANSIRKKLKNIYIDSKLKVK